jgi:hypothetical protein
MEMTKITPLFEGDIKSQMKKRTNHFNRLIIEFLSKPSLEWSKDDHTTEMVEWK